MPKKITHLWITIYNILVFHDLFFQKIKSLFEDNMRMFYLSDS